jgi:hypothetical protein
MVVQSLDVRASRVGYSGTIPYGVLGGHARKYAWLDIGQVYAEVTDCTFDRLLIGWAEQNSKTTIGSVTAVVTGGTIPAIYLGGAHGTSASVNVGSVTATIRNTTFDGLHLRGKSQYATIDGDVTCVLTGDEVKVSATGVTGAQRGESWPVVNGNIKFIVDCNSEFGYVQYIDVLQINAGNTLTVTTNLIPRIRDNGESKLTLELNLPEDPQLNDTPWTVLEGAGLSDAVVRGSEIKLNGQDVVLDTILRDDSSFGVYYNSADKRLEWRKPWSLDETVFDVVITDTINTYSVWQLPNDGTLRYDWGDGTSNVTKDFTETNAYGEVKVSHTWTVPGTYTVRIIPTAGNKLYIRNVIDNSAIYRIRQLSRTYVTQFSFSGATNLEILDPGCKIPKGVTYCDSLFQQCNKLRHLNDDFTVPEGVASMFAFFYYQTVIERLPDGFQIPSTVKNLSYFFRTRNSAVPLYIPSTLKCPAGVTNLNTFLPSQKNTTWDISNFFPEEWKDGGYSCKFTEAFANSSISGTVPSWLWESEGNNFTDTQNCFTGCTGLSNYDEIPASWGGGGCGYFTDVEYTEVEYLETVSGVHQWIDTGVAFDPTQDWLIEVESEALTGYRSSICGSYMDSEHYCITLEWYTSRIARAYLIPSSGVPVDLKGASLSGKQKLTLSYSASQKTLTLTAGGKQYTSQFTVGSAPDSPNLRIFSDHRSNPDALANPSRLYSLRITRAGTVLRDFSPVVSTGGMPYLRDSVTGRFYYNQGSGKFIYG